MKSLAFILLSVVVLTGAGCSRSVASGDFTPPTGRAEDPAHASAGERRLLLATSTDGDVFTPTGDILTDQGNVPDAVVDESGVIYVYYVGQGIEEGRETTAVVLSADDGATWTYRLLTFNNWPSDRDPSDPDVVLLENGTFRMFYTGNTDGREIGILYADSPDGLTFTHQGIALAADFDVLDSTTFFFEDLWHMYVLDTKKPIQYHATSTDGKSFVLDGGTASLTASGKGYIASNPLIQDESLRLFGFSLSEKDIRSFASSNGEDWTAESGVRLAPTEDSLAGGTYLQDSTIVSLADGSYLLVYVADIPE